MNIDKCNADKNGDSKMANETRPTKHAMAESKIPVQTKHRLPYVA